VVDGLILFRPPPTTGMMENGEDDDEIDLMMMVVGGEGEGGWTVVWFYRNLGRRLGLMNS
jgi:hypothetical protein